MYFGNHSYKKQAFHVAMVLNGETSAAILGSTYDKHKVLLLICFLTSKHLYVKRQKDSALSISHREGAASNLKLRIIKRLKV